MRSSKTCWTFELGHPPTRSGDPEDEGGGSHPPQLPGTLRSPQSSRNGPHTGTGAKRAADRNRGEALAKPVGDKDPLLVIEKALDALQPDLRWEVRMHLEAKPEMAQHAIRAVGLHSGRFFVLDSDDGVWHLPDKHNAIGGLLTREPAPTRLQLIAVSRVWRSPTKRRSYSWLASPFATAPCASRKV